MVGSDRVKVYRDPVAQQRDEAEAAAHGWAVVTRELLADGTLRVLFRYGSPGGEVAPPAGATAPAQQPLVAPPPQVEPSRSRSPSLGVFAAIVVVVIAAIGVVGIVLRQGQLFGPPGLSGRYMTSPGSGYGFEFVDGQKVYGMTGSGPIGVGTYTADGSRVRVCFSFLCNDLTIEGDCIVDDDAEDVARYCKER